LSGRQRTSFPWCQVSSQPQKVRFAPDSPLEEAGFELLVPQINSSTVLTSDAMADISLMFVFATAEALGAQRGGDGSHANMEGA